MRIALNVSFETGRIDRNTANNSPPFSPFHINRMILLLLLFASQWKWMQPMLCSASTIIRPRNNHWIISNFVSISQLPINRFIFVNIRKSYFLPVDTRPLVGWPLITSIAELRCIDREILNGEKRHSIINYNASRTESLFYDTLIE